MAQNGPIFRTCLPQRCVLLNLNRRLALRLALPQLASNFPYAQLMSPLSPQPKPTGQLAEAPFDDAQADLILRSSDKVPVHFCVFGNILSLASQTFADMFRIPQKPHD
jgi:hypothetical protein